MPLRRKGAKIEFSIILFVSSRLSDKNNFHEGSIILNLPVALTTFIF